MNNFANLKINTSSFKDKLLFDRDIVILLLEASRNLASLNEMYKQSKIKESLLSSIMLFEAIASSRKEGVNTTLSKMYSYDAATRKVGPEKKVTDNLQIMQEISKEPNKIVHLNFAENICQKVERTCIFRANKEAIIRGSITNKPIYTPPVGRILLNELLGDWEKFINNHNSHIDPILMMIISHYQFEAIHPFSDGNGRTGRILNIYALIMKGILEDFILPLSTYCAHNSEAYDELLAKVTNDGDWKAWILFMLKGINQSSALAKKIMYSMTELSEYYMQKLAPEDVSNKQELVSFIFKSPVLTVASIRDNLNVTAKVARRILDICVKLKLLERHKLESGRVLFLNDRLMDIMLRI